MTVTFVELAITDPEIFIFEIFPRIKYRAIGLLEKVCLASSSIRFT